MKPKDDWGIPLLITSVDYDDNDEKLIRDFLKQGRKCWKQPGVKILAVDSKQAPGT